MSLKMWERNGKSEVMRQGKVAYGRQKEPIAWYAAENRIIRHHSFTEWQDRPNYENSPSVSPSL